jgi:thiol-disulfide isomerase/thioredoxin
MKTNFQSKLIWFFRFLFFIFFFISAFSKIYPNPSISIHLLEKSQFISLGIPFCASTWLSRLLIALEFTISIGFITPYFFRKITLPLSIGLLLFFTVYLTIEVFLLGKTTGNCGCFGQLIPMTPPVSLVKNLVAMLPLFLLYKKRDLIKDKTSSVLNYFGSYICIFLTLIIISPNVCLSKKTIPLVKSKTKISPEIATHLKEFPEITEGKKVLCYFSPTCHHCMKAAETLNKISKQTSIKKHYIVFMNESNVHTKIDEFLSKASIKADYKIIEFIDFPSDTDPPAVLILQNGIIKNRFFGKEENKFEKKKFLNAFEKIK